MAGEDNFALRVVRFSSGGFPFRLRNVAPNPSLLVAAAAAAAFPFLNAFPTKAEAICMLVLLDYPSSNVEGVGGKFICVRENITS